MIDPLFERFQVIDGIIQDNQPLFMIMWVGSVVAIVVAAAVGVMQLDGLNRGILVAAAAVYLLGVQVPTASINIPLNNKIQSQQVEEMDDDAVAMARQEFESRWNQSNVIRTIVSVIVASALIVLAIRI